MTSSPSFDVSPRKSLQRELIGKKKKLPEGLYIEATKKLVGNLESGMKINNF